MGVEWIGATGFDSRRMECYAQVGKHMLEIYHAERVDSVWRPSKFYHIYIDNKWVGTHKTIRGAKLACLLTLSYNEEYAHAKADTKPE